MTQVQMGKHRLQKLSRLLKAEPEFFYSSSWTLVVSSGTLLTCLILLCPFPTPSTCLQCLSSQGLQRRAVLLTVAQSQRSCGKGPHEGKLPKPWWKQSTSTNGTQFYGRSMLAGVNAKRIPYSCTSRRLQKDQQKLRAYSDGERTHLNFHS